MPIIKHTINYHNKILQMQFKLTCFCGGGSNTMLVPAVKALTPFPL